MIPAYHYHRLNLRAHLPDLGLPLMGGVTDRVLHHSLGIAFEKMSANLLENLFILSGLSNQQHLFPILGKFAYLFRTIDDSASILRISQQTDDFGMVCITDNDRMDSRDGHVT